MKPTWLYMALVWAAATTAQAITVQTSDPFYVMQGVHKTNVADSVIASPKVAGFMLRDNWESLEPSKGTRNFAYYDAQLAKASRLNKHVSLGLYAGVANDPLWGNDLNSYLATVATLGARYSSNPLIDNVHISAPQVTNNSMEMYLPSSWNGTTAQQVSIWEKSIDAYAKAFPTKPLILDIAMTPGTKTIDEYARTTLGTRFRAQVDNLKASTNLNASHILEIKRLHAEGVQIGFEFVGPSIDQTRFGGSFAKALGIGESLGGSYYQFYQQDLQYVPNPTFAVSTVTGTTSRYVGGSLRVNGIPEPSTLTYFTIGVVFGFVLWPLRRRAW